MCLYRINNIKVLCVYFLPFATDIFLFNSENYKTITDFTDENSVNIMKEQIELNYNLIKEEAKQIVVDELERIKNDPSLAHLLQQQE